MTKTSRERIIEASLSSFAAHGYDGTTLAYIAESVGIRKPSLYNHFSGKDELYLTVAEYVTEELTNVMTTSSNIHQGKTVKERIYMVLADSTEFIFRKHEGMMYKRLMVFPPPALSRDLRKILLCGDEKIDWMLMNFYEQGVDEEMLKEDSFASFRSGFYCLMDGLFTESLIYRGEEFRERFEGAWTVFWRGVSR